MSDQKSERWLSGIKKQNRIILTEIYNDILPGIIIWVKQNGGNSDDARDLFQEMIISVYKKCKEGQFELTCSFWSYALIVCKNLWYARNRNKDRMTYQANINEESVIIEKNMQEEIEMNEQYKLYRKHFDNLGEKCQKILSMFFAKIKMTEIAEKLEISAAYVKKRKFQCKEELIQKIQSDGMYNELID